jgi:hypothetical protein
MIEINLPHLELRGRWRVTPAERALVRRILAELPPPPEDGVGNRWNAALDTLYLVRDQIRDNSDALFDEQGGGPQAKLTGTITMLDMMFSLSRAANNPMWRLALEGPSGRPDLADRMTRVLDLFEPEVAALRAHLTEAAAEPPQAQGR